MVPLTLSLDPHSATPLHRQLYEEIRAAVLAGRLAAGARLPSTRALAADLHISRNTVAGAPNDSGLPSQDGEARRQA